MSNAKQTAAITVALNDQADAPAVHAEGATGAPTQMAQTLDAPLSGAAPSAGNFQDTGLLLLTALAAVVVLSLRRRQR